jgi:hypothetical protein
VAPELSSASRPPGAFSNDSPGHRFDVLRACADRGPRRRAVLLSNYTREPVRDSAQALGAVGVFDKSLELGAFIAFCAQCLKTGIGAGEPSRRPLPFVTLTGCSLGSSSANHSPDLAHRRNFISVDGGEAPLASAGKWRPCLGFNPSRCLEAAMATPARRVRAL